MSFSASLLLFNDVSFASQSVVDVEERRGSYWLLLKVITVDDLEGAGVIFGLNSCSRHIQMSNVGHADWVASPRLHYFILGANRVEVLLFSL